MAEEEILKVGLLARAIYRECWLEALVWGKLARMWWRKVDLESVRERILVHAIKMRVCGRRGHYYFCNPRLCEGSKAWDVQGDRYVHTAAEFRHSYLWLMRSREKHLGWERTVVVGEMERIIRSLATYQWSIQSKSWRSRKSYEAIWFLGKWTLKFSGIIEDTTSVCQEIRGPSLFEFRIFPFYTLIRTSR